MHVAYSFVVMLKHINGYHVVSELRLTYFFIRLIPGIAFFENGFRITGACISIVDKRHFIR